MAMCQELDIDPESVSDPSSPPSHPCFPVHCSLFTVRRPRPRPRLRPRLLECPVPASPYPLTPQDPVLFCLAADLGSKSTGEWEKAPFVSGWSAMPGE